MSMELQTKDRRDLPIGVFDSGLGGISVLRELVRILPQEDFYYVGDDANAPYGTKSREQIQELTLQHVQQMHQRGIKALVVACNTATSAAIGLLRQQYPDMPVIGIEPALKPAVRLPLSTGHTGEVSRRVIVMATPGTVHGRKYLELMQRYEEEAEILPLGCPGLMEFVERGELHSASLQRYLEELLLPNDARQADAIVLGCTHYPFVRSAIREVVGTGPLILDGSEGTAKETYRRLAEEKLLRTAGRNDAENHIRPEYRTEAENQAGTQSRIGADSRIEAASHTGTVTFHMTLPEKEPLARQLLALREL